LTEKTPTEQSVNQPESKRPRREAGGDTTMVEEVLKKHCPELCKLVVCMADRRVYRQAPKQVPFLL
jgi:hypothetical protein